MQNGCHWFIGRLTAVLALAASMAFSLHAPAGAQQVLKIGEIEAQTGSLNTYGWMSAQGMRMAVAEINNAGGLEVAGKQYNLELVNPDGRCFPASV
jgi:branched-chain amino acid transport system substrate-binding protein